MTTPSGSPPSGSPRFAAAHERFSGVVREYAKYRPDYPPELLDQLVAATGLATGGTVADIGAGTGIFTQMLLARGLPVWAVEPNASMRAEAQARLGSYAGFQAVEGSADQTTLAAGSVKVIFCAQAYHWFDEVATLLEWRRILRPDGWAVLIWNNLALHDDFGRRYVDLMRRKSVDAGRTIDRSARAQEAPVIFAPDTATRLAFAHHQTLALAGLVGRTESASYAPKAGDLRQEQMMAELQALFEKYQRMGK